MPAYDRPIQFNLQPGARPPEGGRSAVAATISFSSNDMDRIKAYLTRMAAAGVIDGYDVREYDPSVSSPTLYFP